jgi:hypothetical protein
MLNYIDLFRRVTTTIQNANRKDPEVKTADPSVFDKLNQRIEQEHIPAETDAHIDMFERMKNHIDEVKYENECDEECETAEPSVFENLQKEIEMLKQKVQAQEANTETGHVSDQWNATNSDSHVFSSQSSEMIAVTNSMGGSLGLSKNPQIGGPTLSIRVPDRSRVTIIEYSQNKINLDGKDCRFAYVDYNGQRGWIPESYLNFN